MPRIFCTYSLADFCALSKDVVNSSRQIKPVLFITNDMNKYQESYVKILLEQAGKFQQAVHPQVDQRIGVGYIGMSSSQENRVHACVASELHIA